MTSTAELTATWAEATDLVVRSDVMAVVVTILLIATWAAAGAIRVRAAVPGAPPRTCLAAAPRLMLDLPGRPGRQTGGANATAGLGAAASSVSLLVLGSGAAGALTLLLTRGHVPPGFSAVGAASAVALLAATVSGVVVRQAHQSKEATGRWLTSRGPHLGLAALVGELALAGSVAAAALALGHTEGVEISGLEVFAAATVARLLTLLRHPAGGAGVADAVLAGLLLGIGSSAALAVGTVVLWRVGMLAGWAASSLMARLTTPLENVVAQTLEPSGSALGELLHRSAFQIVAALPDPLARRTRRLVFQAMFSGSDDPWQYDTMPYEVRKRSFLVASVPPGARTILEVGCAEGHNLRAWGEAHPGARVVGLDISARAVATARLRASHLPNVSVFESDLSGAVATLTRAGASGIDVVVLAEVLYYLGRPHDVRRQLEPLAGVLAPDCLVVLLHPAADAKALHAAAFAALGAHAETSTVMLDDARPVVLETGRRT
ncbi:methyltransferase [Intrasporangium calvum]|uniref:Methyltransferase n=1 Tax=Intrasporangium calvum TaxID=53358 RepID=A0ABT5GJA9_9MICO|nr:methyltransferase [Intrasporangium calvum]MDC5697980.1 methyltransferase [Intrasporangium calvum]